MTENTGTSFTVRFARLPRRGLLLGLSAPRVACVAEACVVLVAALFTTGSIGAAVTSPAWVGLAALAFPRWGGRPVIEALPTAAHYLVRRATGTAVLHDPHEQTLSVAALVQHPAYVLLAPAEQARRVHGWGRTLASLASSGSGVRVQVLEISLPDAGRGITGVGAGWAVLYAGAWLSAFLSGASTPHPSLTAPFAALAHPDAPAAAWGHPVGPAVPYWAATVVVALAVAALVVLVRRVWTPAGPSSTGGTRPGRRPSPRPGHARYGPAGGRCARPCPRPARPTSATGSAPPAASPVTRQWRTRSSCSARPGPARACTWSSRRSSTRPARS